MRRLLKTHVYNNCYELRSRAIKIHSKMKNESVKKSLEKSKNVLEEKRKICIKKTNTFTIIAMNFVQEQLKITQKCKNCHEKYCTKNKHLLRSN